MLPASTAAVPFPPEVTLPGPWQTGLGGPRGTRPTSFDKLDGTFHVFARETEKK